VRVTKSMVKCLVTYIERDVLKTISNDVILAHFQQIENRTFSL